MSHIDTFKSLIKHGAIDQERIPGIITKDGESGDHSMTSALHAASQLKPEHYDQIARNHNFVENHTVPRLFSEGDFTHEGIKAITSNPYASIHNLRELAFNNDLSKESARHMLHHFIKKDKPYEANAVTVTHPDALEPHDVETLHAKYPDSAQLGHVYVKTQGMKPEVYTALANRAVKGPAPTAILLAKNPSLHTTAAMILSKHENPMVAHALSNNESLPRGIRSSIDRNSGMDELDRRLLGKMSSKYE